MKRAVCHSDERVDLAQNFLRALEASKTRLLELLRHNAVGTLSNTGDGAYIHRFHVLQGVLITRRHIITLSNGLIRLIVHNLGAKTRGGIPLP